MAPSDKNPQPQIVLNNAAEGSDDPCISPDQFGLFVFNCLRSANENPLSSTHTSSSSIPTDYSPSDYSDGSSVVPRTGSYTSLSSHDTTSLQPSWPSSDSNTLYNYNRSSENPRVQFYFEEPTSPTSSAYNTESSQVQSVRRPADCSVCGKSFSRPGELTYVISHSKSIIENMR